MTVDNLVHVLAMIHFRYETRGVRRLSRWRRSSHVFWCATVAVVVGEESNSPKRWFLASSSASASSQISQDPRVSGNGQKRKGLWPRFAQSPLQRPPREVDWCPGKRSGSKRLPVGDGSANVDHRRKASTGPRTLEKAQWWFAATFKTITKGWRALHPYYCCDVTATMVRGGGRRRCGLSVQ